MSELKGTDTESTQPTSLPRGVVIAGKVGHLFENNSKVREQVRVGTLFVDALPISDFMAAIGGKADMAFCSANVRL